MDESQLIARLKEGDRAAFKELVERWEDMVYNTSLSIVQSDEDAEDVAQEVFIQVYESIDSFKEQSKLSTWIYRIAVTKSLDAIRKKKRKKRNAFLQSLYSKDDELVHDPADFVHPGVKAENKEEAALLFKAIDKLPENQKTAFVLNRIEMLSYKEVSEIMEVSVNSVDALLQRAKKNLRKKLEGMVK
ncbi:MAG: RNA polymerase sigma factor [Chitinophagaceae bacterium]|nr:RNA polymerase sigma factor [Chitinophagaceae bacterium]